MKEMKDWIPPIEVTHIIPVWQLGTFTSKATELGGIFKKSPYVNDIPGLTRVCFSFNDAAKAAEYYEWGIANNQNK